MKNLLTILSLLILSFLGNAQLNIDSIGHLDLNTPHDQGLNDIWGYVDENGNEYALVGGEKGTSVVDISTANVCKLILLEKRCHDKSHIMP